MKCKFCETEMVGSKTCSWNRVVHYPDHKAMPSVPSTHSPHCPDCGVAEGGMHHPGCDQEVCPQCLGQLISCSCLTGYEE